MNITAIIERWTHAVVDFLPQLVMIAIILALTSVISRQIQSLVQRLLGRTQAPSEIGVLLGRLARFGILLVGVLLVLQQLGWTSTVLGFVTGLGIAGVVVGFALQDIVKQFAAGVLLLILRPFRSGDQVQVGSFEGIVQGIQLRATVLKTVEGDEVLIPNADVYNSAVVNRSRYGSRRRTLSIKVPNTASIEQMRMSIMRAVSSVPGVVENPPPQVIGTALEDKQVSLEIRFWVEAQNNAPNDMSAIGREDDVATTVLETVKHAVAEETANTDTESRADQSADKKPAV